MREISANIRLRPIRIGFLVSPNDMGSLRKIMQACACVWGGTYNPIIPVFRTPPKEWKDEKFERVRGYNIARGYIDFFEPEVFVTASPDLVDKAGLAKLRSPHAIYPTVIPLEDFFSSREGRDWGEPAFGLNVTDVFRHLYGAEQRFKHRDELETLLVKPERDSGLVEAIFGAFPTAKNVKYISSGYVDVFAPSAEKCSPETWLKVFQTGALTPLRIARHGIESQRHWYDERLIYLFDATKPTDLIDCWNMRLEGKRLMPVPIQWVDQLADFIKKIIVSEHRPLEGNPNGIMQHSTLEFGRSITKRDQENILAVLRVGLSDGSMHTKGWRDRIWKPRTENHFPRLARMMVTADERRTSLVVKQEDKLTTSFEPLSPPFASKYGGHHHRWVNIVKATVYGSTEIATVFPFNTYDRSWPRLDMLGEQVLIGTEGWVFAQRYTNLSEGLELLRADDAIIGTLRRYGIEAKLSDPGHIAKQMLQHLEGLWGAHLLADPDTLMLLNSMSGGLRRKSNATDVIEEQFEHKSAARKDWLDLIAKRKQKSRWSRLSLSNFTDHNVIRLGTVTDCPNCKMTNWHSLGSVDYDLICERCLKQYAFPQANLRPDNKNWAYRVVGPFSVPDYGRGAYSVLLTLRAIEAANIGHDKGTFSTAMDLKIGDDKAEVDFVVIRQRDNLGTVDQPQILIGEAKSLGTRDLIKAKDLNKLKLVASKIPNAFVVISVLRNEFTNTEKKRLKTFVQWGRRLNQNGEPSNPVILLTGIELFAEHYISSTWEDLPAPHKTFSDHANTRTLFDFADATQQIYLGIPSFSTWRRAIWEKRHRSKNNRKTK